MEIKAYAKINLTLDIVGLRADGYHEVSMVMQRVGLCDDIMLEKAVKGVELQVDGANLSAGGENLAYRAAETMLKRYDIADGVKILLKKRIPMAAGLAGGSADAAAVICGMKELFNIDADKDEMLNIGAALGSDVPFCIMGGTCLATGRGEVLRKLPDFPETFLTLAKPKISVSTPWAYKTYDKSPAEFHPDNDAFIAALKTKDKPKMFNLMGNVLEPIAAKEYKEIEEYKKIMMENGAEIAQMSGSGPTVFAFAKNADAAEKIADAMRNKTDADVFVTKTF